MHKNKPALKFRIVRFLQIWGVWEKKQCRKPSKNGLRPRTTFSVLAFPRWFEHPTYRLGGDRSIQLSYGNISTYILYHIRTDFARVFSEISVFSFLRCAWLDCGWAKLLCCGGWKCNFGTWKLRRSKSSKINNKMFIKYCWIVSWKVVPLWQWLALMYAQC